MNGKIIEADENHIEFTVHLDQPGNFKLGQEVTINQAKKIRSLKQNSFYWVFLEWLINPFGGDLQSQGHFSVEGLHEDIKSWIKATHEHDFKMDREFTTTELTRQEFKKFFDIVSQDLMVDKLGVDTSGFWQDYQRFENWQTTNPGGMSEYLAERMPF